MSESIWVIETGHGDDYAVLGIYTNRETAEQVASQLGGDDTEALEWPLNPGVDGLAPGRVPWRVTMDPNGQLGSRGAYRETSIPTGFRFTPDKRYLIGCVWATDETHAIEIVNEHRLQARERGEL